MVGPVPSPLALHALRALGREAVQRPLHSSLNCHQPIRNPYRRAAAHRPFGRVGCRYASQIAPTTSVGTPQHHVPAELKKLHASLKELGDIGSTFVDTGQLQLALKSVEAKDGVVRVARTVTLRPAPIVELKLIEF